MNFAGWLLKTAGWKVSVTVPDYPRCIICVAPHTSNWDFIIGKLAYSSVGRKAGFLMKETWFFWPLGALFRSIGGIPVPRGKSNRNGSLVEYLTGRFENSEQMVLAITPEGTRSKTSRWHTGFLRIAQAAGIPIVLGVIDFATKRVMINDILNMTGNLELDMRNVKDFYKPFKGKHPENFSTE